jgi:osmotically-inducible protein OsmY
LVDRIRIACRPFLGTYSYRRSTISEGVTTMPMIFDEAMGQLIRQRLMQDRRTAGVTIAITCADGCISLMGRVDTEEQKNATLFLINGMAGVRSVHDQIIVKQGTIRDL